MSLRLGWLFIVLVIFVSAPLKDLAIFFPDLLLLLPMLFRQQNQVLLSHRFQARNIILTQGEHLAQLGLQVFFLCSGFEALNCADL